MTDQATAPAAAQPIADANSIDTIIDNATTPETKEPVKPDAEPQEPADKPKAWDKTTANAFAHEKGKTAKWRATAQQTQRALQDLEAEVAKLRGQAPQPKTGEKPATDEPQEKDFTSYHDYIRAVNKYDAEQIYAAKEGKQKETQNTQQQQQYYAKLAETAETQVEELIAKTPEARQIFDEHAEIIDACPPEIYTLFLESGEAAQAAFNLMKLGKLEEVTQMSPRKAAIEIGKALAMQTPEKLQSKAPPPLTAARGSVPSGKTLDDSSPDEVRKWLKS